MSVARSRPEEIVAVARELLESEGPDGLSMRRIAGRLGITAGALYKHVPDKRALENELIASGLREQGDLLTAAIAEADDPLLALAMEYRAFALAHPHLYRLMTDRDLDRGDAVVAEAEAHATTSLRAALGRDRTLNAAVWAFAHGVAILELNGRFSPGIDVDEVWRRGLESVRTALPAPADE